MFCFTVSYDAALLNYLKITFFMYLWGVSILPAVSVFTKLPLDATNTNNIKKQLGQTSQKECVAEANAPIDQNYF